MCPELRAEFERERDRLSGRSNSYVAASPPRTTKCPCGELTPVLIYVKEGKNYGRLCAQCRYCGRWQFLDRPLCRRCGERKYTGQSKKNGKCYGKWFLACPTSKCFFMWLSHEPRGGGYEIV